VTPELTRKLRAVESAAASALYNGATPDEIRNRVEVGIAEVLESAWWKTRHPEDAAAH
jgi:hypothetical protein